MIYDDKYLELINYIKDLGKVAIAFSGGVDSTFLLKVAKEAIDNGVIAITIKSPYIPEKEIKDVKDIINELNVTHYFLEFPIVEEIRYNPKDRCYRCKKNLFKEIINLAKINGIEYVLDGSNFDDTKDYRPGMKALEELNIKSPLKELNITKAEIRMFSRKLNLPTWNKPSYACLLSRLPYDTEIDLKELVKIEKSEEYLYSIGFKEARVRSYNNMARIEVNKKDISKFLNGDLVQDIVNNLKKYGYQYVALDLEGYRMGSMNAVIKDGNGDE
ncbi:ATP-dependent sacrificial sulfur transferase LarE [Clostridium lundense]|uniref:ATP-dependent sacrificial sulfur transferase LarE n=1 Tax=Clostridium lundense TaxID=319475 RepID=UPI00048351C1|nr:ATP-dependent sacrificial sulfur transferase LarE [Clostridium lundense]